jgi:hypothetical protein
VHTHTHTLYLIQSIYALPPPFHPCGACYMRVCYMRGCVGGVWVWVCGCTTYSSESGFTVMTMTLVGCAVFRLLTILSQRAQSSSSSKPGGVEKEQTGQTAAAAPPTSDRALYLYLPRSLFVSRSLFACLCVLQFVCTLWPATRRQANELCVIQIRVSKASKRQAPREWASKAREPPNNKT